MGGPVPIVICHNCGTVGDTTKMHMDKPCIVCNSTLDLKEGIAEWKSSANFFLPTTWMTGYWAPYIEDINNLSVANESCWPLALY